MARLTPVDDEFEPIPDLTDDMAMPDADTGTGKAPLPAWRRIEEYREMRALRERLRDDLYGEKPFQDLWEDE